MTRRDIVKKVLLEFEKNDVKYCVLRNYEWLLDEKQEPGFDFDVSIASEDKGRAEAVFRKHGFIKKPLQFSRKHQGYTVFCVDELRKMGFDVQWDGVVWNDMYYLDASIYERRKKIGKKTGKDVAMGEGARGSRKNAEKDCGGFYVLAEEDAFVMYLCHSILGKRYFKDKYKGKLEELAFKEIDFLSVAHRLDKLFKSAGIGVWLVTEVKNGNFEKILARRFKLIRRFVLWNHAGLFVRLFFRWFGEKVIGQAFPLIAVIGPDGAGKSTTTEGLVQVLRDNRLPVEYVYLGRGKSHVLPIDASGRAVYERIKKRRHGAFVKAIYYLAAPVYTLDLLLRYLLIVRRQRRRAIIVTDRYGTDIYLMPKIARVLREALFGLFPRPTLTFYLYNDAKTLYERKKQQSVEELQQQLDMFERIAERLGAVRVRTDDTRKTLEEVSKAVFERVAGVG